ncbi:putative O-methyltransferase YrrM [Virgibacillus natechei]|uniref:tRNA 5-hydroxyuridine methyltransferase n=1 Tax=Virgibacillus natechei TaxID=1216297 RepID=A0ABS4ICS8_9BACI|nr:O-methyltransferase [Virgibacillus natechei]MBP1968749.1 putative O-methyltransferase YrrM [Virgibacillus natechei]UZD11550.1 O-methyltransferase [Virgibacillus natechei]
MEEQLTSYLNKRLPEQEDWVIDLEEQAKKENVPIMEPVGMHFVMQLIKLKKPTRILEIGTAIGYSALRMVEAYPDTSIVTIEKDEARYHQAKVNIKNQHKISNIKIIHGDALDKINELVEENSTFDFIFIDAAKGQYKRYFELASPMLTEEGCILSDNVLFKGYVVNPKQALSRHEKMVNKIQNYNEWLTKHPDFTTSIVPIGDGVAISLKNSWKGETLS